jgi:hypothetical protein
MNSSRVEQYWAGNFNDEHDDSVVVEAVEDDVDAVVAVEEDDIDGCLTFDDKGDDKVAEDNLDGGDRGGGMGDNGGCCLDGDFVRQSEAGTYSSHLSREGVQLLSPGSNAGKVCVWTLPWAW